MEKIFYVTSNYKIVDKKEYTKFKVILDKETHDFNSVDIEDIDGVGFEYKVICFSGWYANNGLPLEEDEDNDFFSCDKWAHRQPYFYFPDIGDNVKNGYGLGDEILYQTHIYEMILNLFLKEEK